MSRERTGRERGSGYSGRRTAEIRHGYADVLRQPATWFEKRTVSNANTHSHTVNRTTQGRTYRHRQLLPQPNTSPYQLETQYRQYSPSLDEEELAGNPLTPNQPNHYPHHPPSRPNHHPNRNHDVNQGYGRSHRSPSGTRYGHRGYTRLPWRRGPREPALPAGGPGLSKTTAVFVDHLPRGISPEWLRDLFSEFGRVEDVFVSKKMREKSSDAFGFVKFRKEEDAKEAISNLNGHKIKNSKMAVSLARYDRRGMEVRKNASRNSEAAKVLKAREGIRYPSFRNSRRYAEVVSGHRKHTPPEKNLITQPTIKVPENSTMTEKLNKAVVVELKETMEADKAAALVSDTDFKVVCISSLNPSTVILFFDSDEEVSKATGKNSPLWKLGDKVSRWSEDAWFYERVVWVECVGIHPKWWSEENIERICEKWGKVVKIEHEVDGLNSLTCARILIKTKLKRRIDDSVRIEWESGSDMVTVREACNCRCKNGSRLRSDETDDGSGEKEGDCDDKGENTQLMVSKEDQQEKEKDTQGSDSDCDDNGENTQLMGSKEDQQGEERDTQGSDIGLISRMGCEDEWLVGPMSCPAESCMDSWFDPIVSVECPISLADAEKMEMLDSHDTQALVEKTAQPKRPRGRPKRIACSLPDTLSVPSTPSFCTPEAIETWKTAKLLGISALDESAVMEELRRSKRIQLLEESNPSLGRWPLSIAVRL